jgi:hypothetical protein
MHWIRKEADRSMFVATVFEESQIARPAKCIFGFSDRTLMGMSMSAIKPSLNLPQRLAPAQNIFALLLQNLILTRKPLDYKFQSQYLNQSSFFRLYDVV